MKRPMHQSSGRPPKRSRMDGGALSLDKFANAKLPNHNKKELLQKAHLKKLNKVGKYKRLLHKLEGHGKVPGNSSGVDIRDRVAEAEEHFFVGDAAQTANPSQEPAPRKKQRRDRDAAQHPSQDPQADDDAAAGTSEQGLQRAAAPPASSQPSHQHGQGKRPPRQPQLEEPQQAAGKKPVGSHTAPLSRQAATGQAPAAPLGQSKPKQAAGRQGTQEDPAAAAGVTAPAEAKGGAAKQKAMRPASSMHRLLQGQQQTRAEADEARAKALEAKAQRQAGIQEAQKHRREEQKRFFKRTRTGQPLMRYRMEKILQTLQQQHKAGL